MIKKQLITAFLFLISILGYSQDLSREKAPDGFDNLRENISHGELDTINYKSQTVRTNREAIVYLPPDFDKSKKYPVLYLLHGIGGDQFAWLKNGQVNHILDNLYHKEKLKPMIVVLPNGRAMKDDRAKGDIFAKDKVEAFANFEDDLINDLIPFIEKKYPVLKDKNNRAISGLSMGGGQSLNFGLGNPKIFTWVGAFSAAPNTKQPSELIAKQKKLKEHQNLLWISCGDQDDLLNISRRTHEFLKEKEIEHIYFIEPGKHDFEVWKNDIYLFSQLLFR